MGSKHDFELVCIGSGPAGQRAAVTAAKLGKRVAIIERNRMVGGGCLVSGTVPSKTFREAVLALCSPSRFSPRNWVDPTERPTALQLAACVQDVLRREARSIQKRLARHEITVIQGEAEFVEPNTLSVTDEERSRGVTGEHILIAVGTEPTPPDDLEVDGEVIVTSDQILNIPTLPKTMAVVGAGVVGLEYASMFGALGVKVTLIDRNERPLAFLDDEINDELLHQMRNAEVTFRLGEAVDRIERTTQPHQRAVVVLASGKKIVADLVLYTVGRTGSTGRLNLGAAGLRGDRRGRLEVDSKFRTEVPHIYAAGDIIGFPSLAATSSEQGRLAACFMFDAPAETMAAHFPIGLYSIPEVSMVGASERTLTERKVPYETGVARYAETARGQILGDESGLLKLIFHRESRKLLGVHAVGTAATELIHVGQAVFALGGGLDYFLDTVFNYPTLAECYKLAAHDAASRLAL